MLRFARQQGAAGAWHEDAAGLDGGGGGLFEDGSGRGFDDDVAFAGEFFDIEDQRAVTKALHAGQGFFAVAHGDGGEFQAGDARVQRAGEVHANGAKADDADGVGFCAHGFGLSRGFRPLEGCGLIPP